MGHFNSPSLIGYILCRESPYINQEVFIEREYLKLPEQLQEDVDDEIEKDDGMSR